MIRYIHCSRMLEKQAAAIRKEGKKGELAANQYDMIITCLKSQDHQCRELYNKRTKKGEQRIRNCIKYDLGCGYRLVTIRVADCLFVPFIGSHDETDQWLERHKRDIFTPHDPLYHRERCAVTTELSEPTPQTEELQEERFDLYEEQLQAKLDEAMLKAVFPGLYNNRAESAATASALDITTKPSQHSLPITKQQQEKHNA